MLIFNRSFICQLYDIAVRFGGFDIHMYCVQQKDGHVASFKTNGHKGFNLTCPEY